MSSRLSSARAMSRSSVATSARAARAHHAGGRGFIRILGALLVALVGLSPMASFSAASAAGDMPIIRKVDTTDENKVALTILPPAATGTDAQTKIQENGKTITGADVKTITDANIPMAVALVIDASATTLTDDALTKTKEAAKAMVLAKKPNQQFALITTQGTGRTIQTFTDNTDAIIASIDNLSASADNALWNAVQLGAGLLQNMPDAQRNLVVVSASPDVASAPGTYGDVRSQLRSANAIAFAVGLQTKNGLDEGGLADIAEATGGRYLSTADPATATQILTGLQRNLQSQTIVTYQSLGGATLDINVQIGTGIATAHVSRGTISEGASVNPVVVEDAAVPFFSGPGGLIITATISLLCVGLLLYGIVELIGNDRNRLSSALRPYQEGGFDPDEQTDFSKLADSEIIKKAIAATGKAAEDRGLLQVVQTRLEQADLPLKPAEALFFTGALGLVSMLVGAIFFQFIGIAVAALLFLAIPVLVTGTLAKRRRKKFTSQLPDTLQLLAGSLRAGYSLVQGLDAVSKQCSAPMSTELLRAMSEARLGRPVEEALQDVSDRMGSDDFEWAVMAIKIQREVGGNLAELLMTVSETMVGRERLRREIKGLTAEGRVSAIVLSGLPFAIGALIWVMNPAYMEPLIGNQYGQLALVGAVIMIGFGYWLMMKMIEIEV
jgi:tight adherence protein B